MTARTDVRTVKDSYNRRRSGRKGKNGEMSAEKKRDTARGDERREMRAERRW